MFKDVLKALRIQKSLNQQQVADHLKISRAAYTNYELGNREPDFETLRKLSKFFNVSSDYLLDFDKIEKSNESKLNIDTVFLRSYSKLDSHGKKLVDAIIEIELERVTFILD